MGLLKFTKSYSASDDGSTLTGEQMGQLQADISAIINAGISNANILSDAAIDESKLAFDTSTGHTHNGTNSAYPLIKHYRRGMLLKSGTTAETDVKVTPGVIDIGGKLFVTTADTNISIATVDNNYIQGSEPADGPVYVYAYNDSGSLGFKLATESPDLSDTDDNTAEFPLRYQKYSTTYYRLVGIVHNRTDISLDMFTNFDAVQFATGSFVADGNDEPIYLGWTPDVIQMFLCSDSTPANGETFDAWNLVQKYGFDTANPQPQSLMYNLKDNQHATSANGTVNSFYNINAQTTAQPGSFTIDAPTNGQVVMWMAWANGMRG